MTQVRVLVVDDDFMVNRVHTGFVSALDGFEVCGNAADGASAISLTLSTRPDVVLLDVHLPDLSGVEVLRRLRAEGFTGEVLMVTAERDVEVAAATRSFGAAGYLVKPFTRADLRTRLTELADRISLLEGHGSGTAEQHQIDALFGSGTSAGPSALPKGLNQATAELVLNSLDDGELSASACAEVVGLSRVTARRYLEHFVGTGEVLDRQQYGRPGRPERLYSRSQS
ncbi:response regulator [Dermacoccaceae bacterium W4C1]